MKMNQRKRVVPIFVIVILGCVTVLFVRRLVGDFLLDRGILLPVERSRIVKELELRVKVGDEREYAAQVLSDAWFHTECRAGDSTVVRDLYFYGPCDPDEAVIVMIESEEANGKAKVRFVGGVDNYMLHIYDYCTPSPTQAFDGN